MCLASQSRKLCLRLTGAHAKASLPRALNALVRKEACAEVAEQIDLGEALMLGRSEMRSGGRRKVALAGRCHGSGYRRCLS